MDLSHEYNVARTHVRSLDFTLLMEKRACNAQAGPTVHLFETVIRYLGGFLSAYEYVYLCCFGLAETDFDTVTVFPKMSSCFGGPGSLATGCCLLSILHLDGQCHFIRWESM